MKGEQGGAYISVLAATNYLLTMQYGRFRPNELIDLDSKAVSIGVLLENEFEKQGIFTELPTLADWGYIFRVKVRKQSLDISVVDFNEDGFGIALEPPKDIISRIFNHESKEAIEIAKSIVHEVLSKVAPNSTLFWYSKDEWLAAFETDFWQQQN